MTAHLVATAAGAQGLAAFWFILGLGLGAIVTALCLMPPRRKAGGCAACWLAPCRCGERP